MKQEMMEMKQEEMKMKYIQVHEQKQENEIKVMEEKLEKERMDFVLVEVVCLFD